MAIGMSWLHRASVARATATIRPLAGEPDEPCDTLLEHQFRLRRDVRVSFRLPADFNSAEASRLADFIKTLPFDRKES
jgi:hypothetical protein